MTAPPVVPYRTPSGLLIGSKYAPPPRREDIGAEAERIQSALLAKPIPRWERIAGVLLAVAVGVTFALIVVYL